MPLRAGRTGWKHSYRERNRSTSTTRYRAAGKQIVGGCAGNDLAYRVRISIESQGECVIAPISPSGHMHRFFISPEHWNAATLTLAGSAANHARPDHPASGNRGNLLPEYPLLRIADLAPVGTPR